MSVNPKTRKEVLESVDGVGGRIVNAGSKSISIEIAADQNKIKALLFDGETLMKKYRTDLNTSGTELGQMINQNEGMDLIKGKLTEISKIQVEVSCYNIEFARKIKGILSPEQLKKWEEIKKEHAKG